MQQDIIIQETSKEDHKKKIRVQINFMILYVLILQITLSLNGHIGFLSKDIIIQKKKIRTTTMDRL